MPSSKEGLKERFARYRQIKISVIGRKSGRTISIPVWFVWKAKSSNSCSCKARTRSITKICLAKASISDFSVGSAACLTSLFACSFDSLLYLPCTFQSGVGGPLA